MPPKAPCAPLRVALELTRDELLLVTSALDSHIYWQLSDEQYRSSGGVLEHGSDDPDSAAEITQATELMDRLAALTPADAPPPPPVAERPADPKAWRRVEGVYTRGDGHTVRAVTTRDFVSMTGGRMSPSGWRRVWVVFDPSGHAISDYPSIVCGGTRAEAVEDLERWERREARKAAEREELRA